MSFFSVGTTSVSVASNPNIIPASVNASKTFTKRLAASFDPTINASYGASREIVSAIFEPINNYNIKNLKPYIKGIRFINIRFPDIYDPDNENKRYNIYFFKDKNDYHVGLYIEEKNNNNIIKYDGIVLHMNPFSIENQEYYGIVSQNFEKEKWNIVEKPITTICVEDFNKFTPCVKEFMSDFNYKLLSHNCRTFVEKICKDIFKLNDILSEYGMIIGAEEIHFKYIIKIIKNNINS